MSNNPRTVPTGFTLIRGGILKSSRQFGDQRRGEINVNRIIKRFQNKPKRDYGHQVAKYHVLSITVNYEKINALIMDPLNNRSSGPNYFLII